MFGKVCNELLVIIKDRLVRRAPTTKQTVPHQYWSTLFNDLLDGSKLVGCGNRLAVACPLIGFDSIPWLEFDVGHTATYGVANLKAVRESVH